MKRPAGAAANSDHLTHLRTLVGALVACGQDLRTLHEQYQALPHEEASHERRETLLHFLNAEQAVLQEALPLLEHLVALLRVDHALLLRDHTPHEAARLPAKVPTARDE